MLLFSYVDLLNLPTLTLLVVRITLRSRFTLEFVSRFPTSSPTSSHVLLTNSFILCFSCGFAQCTTFRYVTISITITKPGISRFHSHWCLGSRFLKSITISQAHEYIFILSPLLSAGAS